jgi:PAS domain-containing protein
MPDNLIKLLKSYEFLNSALHEHGARMTEHESSSIESRKADLFLDIVRHQSREPRITVAQARFLLANFLTCDQPDEAKALREACDRHLMRLEKQVREISRRTPPRDHMNFELFDSMSDRVTVLDRDYRYIFTNRANADFHSERQADFIGRPNWQVTSQRYFETVTKPLVDACLAGQSRFLITPHPNRPSSIFSATFDAMRSTKGTITGVIAVSRDVSALDLPASAIVPLP